MSDQEEKLYSVQEVAKVANVKRITVQKAIELNKLKARKVGSSYVITQSDLEAWLRSKRKYTRK